MDRLNPRQESALQALVNICEEGQRAEIGRLVSSVRHHSNTEGLSNLNLSDEELKKMLSRLYVELKRLYLVDIEMHSKTGIPMIVLTREGYRHPQIEA